MSDELAKEVAAAAAAAGVAAPETTARESVPVVPRVGAYLAKLFTELASELDAVIPRILGRGRAGAARTNGKMDEEAVHDLRVVLRRIRTLMKLARPVYGRFHADAVRKAFAEAMKATGELRDEEVLEETLGALVLKHDAFLTFRRRRGMRERRLRRDMVTNVRKGALTQALAMLRALVILPVDPKNDKSLAKFARRVVAKAEAEVERQKSAPTDDVSLLHELRIAYKELRYTVELFEPALPPETVTVVKSASKMQKRLGEVHDLDVAILTVARARVMPLVARRAALGELEVIRDAKVQKYIEEKTPATTTAPPVKGHAKSRAPASSTPES